ncbi:cobalamin-binding protein [Halalkalicoccus jeotgali]|uniref:Periplasmic binding protein n=1 Tax=Halalkalicoccus jeotgali (strain DSM 18796 / CECT 7217 / JCM 14584 / KCTC 4019 / B3) TaxID=795797 RepID=D8J9Q0_HALJB|nr:cobalamin-binding protein [Halalkalicoccus jeotgali]ADJ16389.1 periplasmic binding protein [Halalkalicoccus jeotgali B3]ELY37123.1 periplasmic binding protein [Halalkalicoccus jeotgali B3]
MNVLTLLPSATEIVCALGVTPVGVSHSCDHPPAVGELPTITRSRVDAGADSATIDEQVLAAERAGGVYEIRMDELERAEPDLIVTQGVCEVCAVDTVLVREAVEELDLDCEVLTTDPHSLEDVLVDIERIGRALGREQRAGELLADLRARVEAVRKRSPDDAERPRVLDIDWMDPVMIGGHWVPELFEIAGAEYGLVEAGEASTPVEWDSVVEYDPEALAVAPCGFDLKQTLANLGDLRNREGWSELTAVREGRVVLVDGSAYLNRPSHRLVDSLEALASTLHPDRFDDPPAGAVRRLTAPRSLD